MLELVWEDTYHDRRLRSFESIKIMIRYGANHEEQWTLTRPSSGGRRAKANELMNNCFDADKFSVLEDTIKKRASETKKKREHIKEDAKAQALGSF